MDFQLSSAVAILQRTPAVLRELLAGLPDAQLRAAYGPNTWSAHEVVAHLIFADETDWIPRLRFMLAEGDARPLPPFDRAGHGPLARAHGTAALLDLFAQRRSESLHALETLAVSPAILDRRGLHPALGPVTARQLISTWTAHDLNHIAQICKALAHQWRPHVGPWEAYLSVLAPPNPR